MEPQQTSCCGHHLSVEASARLQREGKVCPMCNEQQWTAALDKYHRRRVREIRVRCPHKRRGCDWEGEVGDFERHAASCPKQPWECPHCALRCTYGEGEGKHWPSCSKFPEPCPNGCEVGSVERCHLEQHCRECPLEPVACEMREFGCSAVVPRKDLATHMRESELQHLTAMAVLNLCLTRHLQQDAAQKDEKIAQLLMLMNQHKEELKGKMAKQKGELNKEISEQKEELVKEITEQKEELKKEIALQKEELKKEIAEQKEELKKEMAKQNRELKKEISEQKEELKKEITEQKEELKNEITEQEEELKKEIAEQKEELKKEMAKQKGELRRGITKEIAEQKEELKKETAEQKEELKKEMAKQKEELRRGMTKEIVKQKEELKIIVEQNEELKKEIIKQAGMKKEFADLKGVEKLSTTTQYIALHSTGLCELIKTTFNNYINRKEKSLKMFGDAFYTHECGYKLRLIIENYPDPNNDIGAFLCLERGEYDDRLSWPVKVKIHLELLNQVGDDRHVERSKSFQWKKEERGNTETIDDSLMKYADLERRGVGVQYMRYDCLQFRLHLTVQAV